MEGKAQRIKGKGMEGGIERAKVGRVEDESQGERKKERKEKVSK